MDIIKLTAHFLLIINVYCIQNNRNQQVNENEVKLFTECVLSVSDNALSFTPTILIITDTARSSDQRGYLDGIAKILDDRKVPHVLYDLDKIDMNHLFEIFEQRLLAVIYAESCFLNQIYRNIIVNYVKYLIITNPITNNKCSNEFQNFGFETRFYDVTFIVKNNLKKTYDLVSFLPEIDPYSCKPDKYINASHIDTCIDGNEDKIILKTKRAFPVKNPRDFKKCPIKLGLATLFPYSTIKNFTKLNNYDPLCETDIKGSDFEILKIFADRFNITLQMFYIYRHDGNPFLNTEFIEFVRNGSLDLCAGGLYRIYGNEFEYSGVYSLQFVNWIYTAERIKQTWQVLVSKVNGLYIFFLFYISYSIIWYIFCQFDKEAVSISKTLINGWGALVGATSLSDARSAKQKILNIAYLILCIHLSVYISIHLYSFLTIRGPPKTFKTTEEIMGSDKTPYLIPLVKFFLQDEKYLEFANTSKDCIDFKDCEIKTFNNDGITVILDAEYYSIQLETEEVEEVKILKVPESLLMVYHEILLRKNSTIVVTFQKFIERLFEAGICNRLYKEAIGILRMSKKDIAYKQMTENSYRCQSGCPITISQTAGAFYLWILGCVIAFCVFVLEVLSKTPIGKVK